MNIKKLKDGINILLNNSKTILKFYMIKNNKNIKLNKKLKYLLVYKNF